MENKNLRNGYFCLGEGNLLKLAKIYIVGTENG